jgi:chemotaxis protein CheY-P-specific phosphatase CheC
MVEVCIMLLILGEKLAAAIKQKMNENDDNDDDDNDDAKDSNNII